MSHVCIVEAATKDQQITDLPAMAEAAKRLGLEFRSGQKHYHTWATDNGRLYGDYPLPEGFTEKDIVKGECDHAIVIPEDKRRGDADKYEIGLIKSRKNEGTYILGYDFYGGSLDRYASTSGDHTLNKLRMMYQVEAAKNVAAREGNSFVEQVEADGGVTATVRPMAQ